MILRSDVENFLNSWRDAWSKWIARRCRCKSLFDSKISLQMRQTRKRFEKVRMINETDKQIENLQDAIIDWKHEIFDILYDEMLDISKICRREKFDVLYDKMINFSNHLLKIEDVNLTRFDFASVCCWKFFEFDVFDFWLIDLFWLTAADLK